MHTGIARGGGTVASTSTNREVTAPRQRGDVTGGEKLLLLNHLLVYECRVAKTKPTPETLNAIGRALGVDPTHLMRLAGIPLPTSKTKRHPSVEYIAQRLDELPPDIQERAVEALGTQLDLICDMYLENQRLLIVISAEKLDRQENSGETEEKSSTS